MGLVRTWWRQVARAAGASLIAPLVLLLAAGVVASGGGLGGLDSLGQIASGPSLPETGLVNASSASIEDAEIVGAGVPARPPAAPSAPPGAEVASAGEPTAPPPTANSGGPPVQANQRSSAGRPVPLPPAAAPGGGTLVDEPERGPPAPAPDQVDDLQETTEGLGESLSEPLRPVTNQLLDLLALLGVPPP